jgi:hypothetical protein
MQTIQKNISTELFAERIQGKIDAFDVIEIRIFHLKQCNQKLGK